MVKSHSVCPEQYVLVGAINIEIQLPFVLQGDVQSSTEWWDGHRLAYRQDGKADGEASIHPLLNEVPPGGKAGD